jgi:hypothetical protein
MISPVEQQRAGEPATRAGVVPVREGTGMSSVTRWIAWSACALVPLAGRGEPAAPSADSPWRHTQIQKERHHGLPAWCPDGRTLAFVSYDTPRDLQVWITESGGERQRLVFDSTAAALPAPLEMMPCALHWLGGGDRLMLAVQVFDPSRAPTNAPGPVFYTQRLEAVTVRHLGPGSDGGPAPAPPAPVTVAHVYSHDRASRRQPSEFRVYLLPATGAPPPSAAVRIDTTAVKLNQDWHRASHSAVLPDGEGIAVLFCADDDSADEGHAGGLVTARSDGTHGVASRAFRWIQNLPDGRLVGGRHDGAWLLDGNGELQTELVRLSPSRRLDVFRLSPDGRRMIWGEFVFRERRIRWWLQEGADARPLEVRRASGEPFGVANVMFLTGDRLLVHASTTNALLALVAGADGRNAREWLPEEVPAWVSWLQVSPWGNAALVLGRSASARSGRGPGACLGLLLRDGSPVPGSPAEVPIAALPILNLNARRPLMPLVAWAPGRPAYAFASEPDALLRAGPEGAAPPGHLTIVWARE